MDRGKLRHMRDLTDETEAREGLAKRRQDDFDQQQREASGVDVGQIARFYPGQAAHGVEAQKKKAKEQAYRDLLELYLQDPEYAVIYAELGEKLSTNESAADAAINAYEAEIAQMDGLISEMENDAARGPDGQAVFKYADGRVVDANGDPIRPEIAEGIIWPDNAPRAEDYFRAKEQRNALEKQLDEWQTYRNDTLGGIRDRYDDRGNPMSKDESGDALDQIDRARPASLAVETSHAPKMSAADIAPSAFPTLP